jgi:4-amino-4-deoxy-L-arabinose transferase-like glycosyltransferase
MAKTKKKIEAPASAELKEVAEVAPSEEPAEVAAWLEKVRELVPTEKAALIAVFAIGFLTFFPYLGTLGLWDCWEPHYAEVAREMIVRGDYVYPFWESHYFFSKPAAPIWMIVIGMLSVGSEARPLGDPLGHLTEWGIRTPFALVAIFTLWAVYRMTKQVRGGDRIAGLMSVVVLASSAFFIFIGKQAMADMPLVGFMTIGLAFFCAAVFAEEPDAPGSIRLRALTAFTIAFCAFGQLAVIAEQLADNRGAIWPVIPPAILGVGFIAYLVIRGTRFDCYLAIFYVMMALAALSKGLAPLAVVGPTVVLYMVFTGDWRVLLRSKVYVGWLLFLLVASPWYVTLSLFGGRDEEGKTFVERFWIHDNFNRVGAGVHGDRAGMAYYIEQLCYGMFPWAAALPFALGLAARHPEEETTVQRRRLMIFILLWAVWSYVFFTMSQTKFHHYIFPGVPAFAILIGIWLVWVAEDPKSRLSGYSAILIAMVFAVAIRDLVNDPQHLVNLFTYKYDRDYPREINPRAFLIALSAVAGVAMAATWALRQKANALLAFGATGIVFGVWISHYHFNMLAPHWSQAHLFETYFEERKADEPLYAYQLNWRGETFYSRNKVIQVKEDGANERMRAFVDRPGREFIVTEQSRYHTLKNVLSPDKREKLQIIDKSNNKFYLCVVEE